MERQYIGTDLHKASFHACAVTETGMRLWEASFPRSAEGIAALAAREVAGAHLAVEATGPTWTFVDAVTAIGVQACVVDPRKTKLKAGFAAKTDRLDARGRWVRRLAVHKGIQTARVALARRRCDEIVPTWATGRLTCRARVVLAQPHEARGFGI